MTAEAILSELENLGVKVEAHGDKLRLEPADVLTPDLINEVKSHKHELLSSLARRMLRGEAGDDCDHLRAKAYESAVITSKMREMGEIPDHYTAVMKCGHCGPVPIFKGAPDNVFACPWCFNRILGKPMPRLAKKCR